MQLSLTTRAILLAACCALAMSVSAWRQSRNLSVDEIVSRMEQVQAEARDHSVPYTVTREYQLSSEKAQKPKSQVLAQINFVPPSQKDYTVRKVEGSDRGTDIVRRVLEHESRDGHSRRIARTHRSQLQVRAARAGGQSMATIAMCCN